MAELQGNGVPSTSTVGNVDDIYTDLLTNLKYKCTRITARELYKEVEQEYTWELLPPWEQVSNEGTPGEDGGYYTPSVDASGNLTWTASKEGMIDPPASVNIKGPKGETGPQGPQGLKGDTGETGPSGDPSSLLVTGTYTGNGSTQTITLGFKPRAVFISTGKSETSFCIADPSPSPTNPADVTITSTGFSLTYEGGTANISGNTYVYVAFK